MTSPPSDLPHLLLLSYPSNWVFGGFLLALGCLSAAIWIIVQAATLKEYPEEMTIVFFYCCFVTIQCSIVTLIVERNSQAFSAIFGSVFRTGVHTWCFRKKGPVYVALFKPLGIAIAVALGVTFLRDTLHLGSVMGDIIIAFGFYSVCGDMPNKRTRFWTMEGVASNPPPKRPLFCQTVPLKKFKATCNSSLRAKK